MDELLAWNEMSLRCVLLAHEAVGAVASLLISCAAWHSQGACVSTSRVVSMHL
jgi:hypothetical protein